MAVARQVLPNSFYFITRRCTQRQFLLRPDEETTEAFLYCLIVAAARFQIDLLGALVMSNHYHSVIYDRWGRYPEFIEHLHKLVARSQNCLRHRWENFWASEETCVVRLETRDAVIDKLAYTFCNPVQDDLVERSHQWPGLNTLGALRTGKRLEAKRPRHFFREDGEMPPTVELSLAFPESLGPAETFRAEVAERVEAREAELREERRKSGRRVLGRRAVLEQDWRARPETFEPRRKGIRPRVAARSVWARVEALLRNRIFGDAYKRARVGWLAGLDVVFPPGTYWLRRFAAVPIAGA